MYHSSSSWNWLREWQWTAPLPRTHNDLARVLLAAHDSFVVFTGIEG